MCWLESILAAMGVTVLIAGRAEKECMDICSGPGIIELILESIESSREGLSDSQLLSRIHRLLILADSLAALVIDACNSAGEEEDCESLCRELCNPQLFLRLQKQDLPHSTEEELLEILEKNGVQAARRLRELLERSGFIV